MYPDTLLHIDGEWRPAEGGRADPVLNPATEEQIGTVAHASRADLDDALAATERGFAVWRERSAFERAKTMRKAADLMRERADQIARIMTMEQGKPLAEAKMETLAAADVIDWFAEEARRAYGRVVPARGSGIYQLVVKEPVGPVAAFTPWNFPINQVVRKVSGALAAGCSIIVKAPEETPAAPAELIRAFVDAGVPTGVIGLVYGVPSEISEYLVPHPIIRKVTFTGSTAVGKHLAALAGRHMKRVTMELGGHAPVIVMDDADVAAAAKQIAGGKFRNAGQVCVSPTRFLVQEKVYDEFVERFTGVAKAIEVGDGLAGRHDHGPARQRPAHRRAGGAARRRPAEGRAGAHRRRPHRQQGLFFRADGGRGRDARNADDERGAVRPARHDAAVRRPRRGGRGGESPALRPRRLRLYALGEDGERDRHARRDRHDDDQPPRPGLARAALRRRQGVGYGSEGGSEAIEAYLNPKLVTQAGM